LQAVTCIQGAVPFEFFAGIGREEDYGDIDQSPFKVLHAQTH